MVKLFQGRQRSLFGEILDWMLTPFLLLWPITFGLTWLVAEGIAQVPFDRALQQNVNVLAQLVHSDERHVSFQLPPTAHMILQADATDTVYYQVLGGQRELLGGEAKLPLPQDDEKLITQELRLRDDEMNGTPIRVAYMWVRVQPQDAHPALVQVAETLEKRSVLAHEIIRGVMLPLFVILPLSVLLVWLALTRGIKPLNELEDRIRQRKPGDMSPLDEQSVPSEVVPLVSSINDLLQRLQGSIATQKRFLADAAHQLKTPLAGLRMQADLAQRSDANAQDLKQSLKQIGRASMRATHTVNQLVKRMAFQERSFNEIGRYIKNKEQLLAATPAIQPVSNKNLKRVGSGYGYRIDPVYKTVKFHAGLDFTAPQGTPIYATANGSVQVAGNLGNGFGNHVVINHGFGYQSLYGHCSRLNVRQGQKVNRGDIIGFVGSTGKSTGPHVHYEVIRNGEKTNPINYFFNDLSPEEYQQMIEMASRASQSFD